MAGHCSGYYYIFIYDSGRIQFRPFFCRLVSASSSRFRNVPCSFDASGVVSVPSSGIKNNRGKQRLLIPSFKDLTILTVIFTFRLRSK